MGFRGVLKLTSPPTGQLLGLLPIIAKGNASLGPSALAIHFKEEYLDFYVKSVLVRNSTIKKEMCRVRRIEHSAGWIQNPGGQWVVEPIGREKMGPWPKAPVF